MEVQRLDHLLEDVVDPLRATMIGLLDGLLDRLDAVAVEIDAEPEDLHFLEAEGGADEILGAVEGPGPRPRPGPRPLR